MKLGITAGHITNLFGFEKGFRLIKDCGFDSVDVSLIEYPNKKESVFYKSEDEFLTHFSDVKKICDDLELTISQTHGMLTTCVPDKEESDHIKWGSELQVKATDILKAPVCVFHSVKLKQWEDVSLEPEFLSKINIEFFQDFLSPVCEKYNVKFGMETHGKSIISTGIEADYIGDARNFKANFDKIKSDYKTICMDTGHINEIVYMGTPDVPETIRILGKDITVLHLHDNEGRNDTHSIPLSYARSGVNWVETFKALDEIGYNGVYNYELNLTRYGKMIPETLEFLGKFLRYFTENKGNIK